MPLVKVHHQGKSHQVEAASAFEAGPRYQAAAAGNPSWDLPRLLPGDTCAVEAPDGTLIEVAHEQAMRWGAREAERRAAVRVRK